MTVQIDVKCGSAEAERKSNKQRYSLEKKRSEADKCLRCNVVAEKYDLRSEG